MSVVSSGFVSSSVHAVERAGAWMLRSGIQEPFGGVARYYRIDLGRNAAVSTEITGYALSAYCYLYNQIQDPVYLAAANRAADFLCEAAWNRELDTMPFELYPAPAYFFDCGIIARGLLALYRLTRRDEHLQMAKACARTMARDFAIGRGKYHPVIELPSREPRPHGPRWSQGSGCYQLKSGLAWFELFEETGDAMYADLYRDMMMDALAGQAGFLPGADEESDVMDRLHPYCYFLEGMLPVMEDGRLATEMAAAIDRAGAWLRKVASRFVRADAYAQLLRVRLLASACSLVPLDEDAAREEYHALASFQLTSADLRLDGGFNFGQRGGALTAYANPVTTAFGLQALDAYQQWTQGRFALTRQNLI